MANDEGQMQLATDNWQLTTDCQIHYSQCGARFCKKAEMPS